MNLFIDLNTKLKRSMSVVTLSNECDNNATIRYIFNLYLIKRPIKKMVLLFALSIFYLSSNDMF